MSIRTRPPDGRSTGFPSTTIESDGPARSPSLASWPLTVTRPAAIQVSISRREPSPAAASSFCNRSAVGAGSGALDLFFGFWLSDFGFGSRRFHSGRFGSRHDLEVQGLGDLLERRQLFHRAQPEIV